MAATPTLAQEEDFARSGFYAGINAAGTAYVEVDSDARAGLVAIGYAPDPDSEEPPGVGARVGYRFHPNLAGEAQLQWFSHAKTDFTGYFTGDPETELRDVPVLRIETLSFTGNAKAYLPIGRFHPFALVGAGILDYSVEDKIGIGMEADGVAFVGRFGGGLDVYFNEHVVLVLDSSYMIPTGGASRLEQIQVSVGLNYRF